MMSLLGHEPWPWVQPWFQRHQAFFTPPTNGYPWVMPIVSNPTDRRPTIFMQSMLLADVALRLAGIWYILHDARYPGKHKKPEIWAASLEKHLMIVEEPDDIYDKKDDSPRMKHLLNVMALRDSFMHGELPTGGSNIRKYREEWINSSYYNLYRISEACLDVWHGFLQIMKVEMLHELCMAP